MTNNRFILFCSTARGFYALLSALVVLSFIMRGLFFPAAPTDDAEQLLFSQGFRWGYDIVNPPLYTWLVMAVQQIVGVEFWSVFLVKFPAYWLIFHFLFILGRQVLDDDFLTVLAALSPLWLYYIAWDAVQSYSHTVLAAALILAALVTFLRLQKKGGTLSYILFGAVLGIGMLSKYTFGLAALSILVSGLIHPSYRRRTLHPGMLISLALAAVIFTPHMLWLYQQSGLIGDAISVKFGIGGNDTGLILPRLKGLLSAFTSGIGFMSPLWLVLLVVFWYPVRRRLKVHEPLPPAARFLAIYFFVIIALLILFVLLSGTSKVRTHYMAIFIPFPVLFFAWLKPALHSSRRGEAYLVSLIALAVLLVGALAGKYVSEPLRCKRCQLLMPYQSIGQNIRDAGFENGTLFAYYFPHDLAGNLRVAFPDTRIVSSKFPSIAPPLSDKPGQCLIIWMPAPSGVMDAQGMLQMANKHLNTGFALKDLAPKEINFDYDRTDGRKDTLHYILVNPGQGYCR